MEQEILLYTVCDKNDGELPISSLGVKKVAYPKALADKLLAINNDYYVYVHIYDSETDMNERIVEQSSYTEDITEKNLLVKDGEFFGVVCVTRSYSPRYTYATFDQNGYINLSGGYNEFSYTWSFKKRNKDN